VEQRFNVSNAGDSIVHFTVDVKLFEGALATIRHARWF